MRVISLLKMEAVWTVETLVNLEEATRRIIPEHCHLRGICWSAVQLLDSHKRLLYVELTCWLVVRWILLKVTSSSVPNFPVLHKLTTEKCSVGCLCTPSYPCVRLCTPSYPCVLLRIPVYAFVSLCTPSYPCVRLCSPNCQFECLRTVVSAAGPPCIFNTNYWESIDRIILTENKLTYEKNA
jgi:hypothetical protein